MKQKDIIRDFTKSNIHIRGYMMKAIYEYVSEVVKYYPNSVFILPNSDKAISYDPEARPPELDQYIEAVQFGEVIRKVNYYRLLVDSL